MMNKYQLIALWIGIIIVAALCVFPPEYYRSSSVNFERLIPYCVAAIIITAGLIVTFSSPNVAKAVLLRVLIYGLIIIIAAGITYLISLEIMKRQSMIAPSSTKSKSKYSHLLEENRRQTEGDQKKKNKYARLYEEEEEKQERVNSADCNLPYDTDQ